MLVAVEDYMALVEMVDKVLIAGLMLVAPTLVVAATELPH
jgi:hypothetical protein